MQKAFLLIIAVDFIINTANSQITKGNWLVGGNANFSSTNYSGSIISSYTQTNVQISPVAGYFLVDKIGVGLRTAYSYTKTTLGTSSPTFNTFSAGPFIRYYFLPTEKMLNIFSEANYQYGIVKNSGNPSSTSNGFAILAGPVMYFNPSVGIEFTIGYSFNKYVGDAGSKINAIQVGIGLHIY